MLDNNKIYAAVDDNAFSLAMALAYAEGVRKGIKLHQRRQALTLAGILTGCLLSYPRIKETYKKLKDSKKETEEA